MIHSHESSAAGVPTPQVAEWARHSVEMLLRVYTKCIAGQDEAVKRRISIALHEERFLSGA